MADPGSLPGFLLFGRTVGGVNVPLLCQSDGTLVASGGGGGGFPAQMYMGGSRYISPVRSSSFDVVSEWVDLTLDGTALSGMTVVALVQMRTLSAGTSVTMEIFNVTTSTQMVASTACTATASDYSGTNQQQSLSFTPTAGVNVYRARIKGSNTSADYFGQASVLVTP